MGMGAFAMLVALLVLALVLGGLTAGLALLIVGLAKDRRGMWITGLVLLLSMFVLITWQDIAGLLKNLW